MTIWCRCPTPGGSVVAVRRDDGLRVVRTGGSTLPDLRRVVNGEFTLDDLDVGEVIGQDDHHMVEPLGWFPRNMFCVGKNYREHAAEFTASGYDSSSQGSGDEIPTDPIIFSKPATAVIGPSDVIELHPGVTSELDYEAELAVVIGRGGRGISRADALDHVFGYTIVNDITARDLQRNHRQWLLGKGLDTFCPIGPAVISADEFDLLKATVKCEVNGELRQKASVSNMIFDIPTLISTISAGITLVPGDVIATGTPAGVGIGFDPPRFLQAGDEVAVTIDPIGTLKNRIGAA